MRVGLISDTHIPQAEKELPVEVVRAFQGVDLILHAGDIVSGRVLARLEESGVIAVCGNMDDYEVAGSLPQARIVEASGKKIGLIHGWGSREGLEWRILRRFEDPMPDIIVYGHSHVPFWDRVDGVLMFNPGSAATGGYRSTGTVGLIEIEGDRIEARHISLKG